jgi:protocatechuate 3,4-dioxygenase beta subunit
LDTSVKFYVKPAPGEPVETAVSLERDLSAAVSGTVISSGGAPVGEALVLLFRAGEEKTLIGSQLTDDEGQFFFGPIEGDVLYQIKIYKNTVKVRELEVIAD